MSKHDPIRKDKTCQNCRHVVEQRYCTNCGQENTDSRKTFHHLFVHFFEDLTHYENAFWKTIRHLITKPGRLTKEYLSGKRLSYLAPIRLYIFISFVTFFLIAVLPDNEESDTEDHYETETSATKKDDSIAEVTINKDSIAEQVTDSVAIAQEKAVKELVKHGLLKQNQADSVLSNIKKGDLDYSSSNFMNARFETVRQLDSAQKFCKPHERLNATEYFIYKRYIEVTSHNTKEEIFEKFKESFMHNLPKVLFIYMPIFAFFLWLFNDKSRWYYFDHGIFTLHYFSFLLLMMLISYLVTWVTNYLGDAGTWIDATINIPLWIWLLYYFFPAHHRFYGDSRGMSFLISIVLLFINTIIVSIIMFVYSAYTLLYIH